MQSHSSPSTFFFFFFNDTATTEIYPLSLHDALPIYFVPGLERLGELGRVLHDQGFRLRIVDHVGDEVRRIGRSEEHTSELQSQSNIVCRLLLEKKKADDYAHTASRH